MIEETIDEETTQMEEQLEAAAEVEQGGAEDAAMNDNEKTEDDDIVETGEGEEEKPAATENAEEDSETKTNVSAKHQIYIGNIGFETKGEDVKTYFETFGELSVFTLSKPRSKKGEADDKKKLHRGFAFLGYVDESIAKTVLEKKDHKVDDRTLNLSVAKPKTTRFFVGGLDKGETKDETLRTYFEKFGEITDLFNCRNKGFCFVTMVDDGTNVKKILDQKKHEIDGKMRDVGRAKKRPEGSTWGKGGGRGRGRGRRGRGRGRGRGGRGGWGGMPAMWGSYGGWNPAAAYGQQYHPYGAYGQYRPY